jgi:hypothetical protein
LWVAEKRIDKIKGGKQARSREWGEHRVLGPAPVGFIVVKKREIVD